MIKEETKISEYKIVKALNLIRKVTTKDAPNIFKEKVEVDDIYLGGQKKNKNEKIATREGDDKTTSFCDFSNIWQGIC